MDLDKFSRFSSRGTPEAVKGYLPVLILVAILGTFGLILPFKEFQEKSLQPNSKQLTTSLHSLDNLTEKNYPLPENGDFTLESPDLVISPDLHSSQGILYGSINSFPYTDFAILSYRSPPLFS